MGTDVHLRVERFIDGAWLPVEDTKPNPYHADDPEDEPAVDVIAWYRERNYDLFAILADVRNGHGFAGVYTGEGFRPIAEQRGIPADCAAHASHDDHGDGYVEYKYPDGYWLGDHSHSWLTFRELDDYDWAQMTTRGGVINGPQYDRWSVWAKENGEGPKEWCGDISGSGINHVSEAEMWRLVEEIKAPFLARKDHGWGKEFNEVLEAKLGRTYCRVHWRIMYSTAAGKFYQETMPRLKQLARQLDPDRVRIVFGFDS